MLINGMSLGLVGFLVGIILGSLAKALADRSLGNESFLGRSYCPKCNKTLRWYDLFPVLSYLFLVGRCRYCKKAIGKQYLLVEILMGLLVGFLFFQSSFNLPPLSDSFKIVIFLSELILKTFFLTILTIVTLTDIKETIIPDKIVLPAIAISFLGFLALSVYKTWYLYYYLSQSVLGRLLIPPHSDYFYRHVGITFQPLIEGVLAGLLIGGFFLGLIIITRGKGMGGGDVKLGAFLGLNLGLMFSLIAVSFAFFSGAIWAVLLILLGKKHFGESLPFGPFLVTGSLTALFLGKYILDWYLHLYG